MQWKRNRNRNRKTITPSAPPVPVWAEAVLLLLGADEREADAVWRETLWKAQVARSGREMNAQFADALSAYWADR